MDSMDIMALSSMLTSPTEENLEEKGNNQFTPASIGPKPGLLLLIPCKTAGNIERAKN